MSEKPNNRPPAGDRPFKVLVIDDEHLFAQAIGREIERQGISCDIAYNAKEALRLSQQNRYDLFLLDHKLPDDDGIRIIPLLLTSQPRANLIMMTAFETIPNAVKAIRQGADDYLVKQTSVAPIAKRVKEVAERHRMHQQHEGWEDHKRSGLIGTSNTIIKAIESIEKVARSRDTIVLLNGESGVGKEIAAMHLHTLSVPDNSPFIPVDCVALPAHLVESILFGHEKGAFTGADKTTDGAFMKAGSGTIFLDEIGDMSLDLQGKLLRVLESRKFQRVGSVTQYDVKARVVAATHRDLGEMAREGKFRFDLYQRLSVFPIYIPPLRERREDIVPLAQHFVDFISAKLNRKPEKLSPEVSSALQEYDFPGNVRELKNVIERAIVLAGDGPIESKHLPERIFIRSLSDNGGLERSDGVPIDFIPGVDSLETLEKKMILHALKQAKGVKSDAAEILGISRFQLMRRIEKYGLKEGEE